MINWGNMINRHFFRMLIGLICMGLFGLIGLFFINNYQKDTGAEANIPVTNLPSDNN